LAVTRTSFERAGGCLPDIAVVNHAVARARGEDMGVPGDGANALGVSLRVCTLEGKSVGVVDVQTAGYGSDSECRALLQVR
jgi:hypothetical protein